MKKHNQTIMTFAALILSVPALHSAASSSSCGPLVASSSTDSAAPQKVNTVFALIGNDAKIADGETPVTFRIDSTKVAFINTETASKYSSILDHIAHTVLPALASQSTTLDITEQHLDVDAPGKLLLALTTIMHRAHEQEQCEKTVSAFQLSEKPSVITQMNNVDLEGCRTLFDLAHMYDIKPIITDVIAIFALRHFYEKHGILSQCSTKSERLFTSRQSVGRKFNDFIKSLNPVASLCIEKQLYLSVPKEITSLLTQYHPTQNFTISMQDLFDFNTLHKRAHPVDLIKGWGKDFSFLHINDLTGIQHVPYIAKIETLLLSNNKLTTIPAGAFSDFINLQRLDLSRNEITYIAPDAFANLTNLRWLYLRNNPIDPADHARIEAEVKAIAPNAEIYW